MAWMGSGIERMGKMKPERKIAGSMEVTIPTWKAIAWVSARLDTRRPKPKAPTRYTRVAAKRWTYEPRTDTPKRKRAAMRMMTVAVMEMPRYGSTFPTIS